MESKIHITAFSTGAKKKKKKKKKKKGKKKKDDDDYDTGLFT